MTTEQVQHDTEDRHRFMILIGAAIAVGVLVLGGFFWLTGGNDEEGIPDSSIELSAEEQASAEDVATDFLQHVGNFGYDFEQIDGDNIFQIVYLNQRGEYQALSMLADFRSDVYLSARDEYIAKGGPLYYPSHVAYEWDHPVERDNIISYRISNLTATVPDTAQTVQYDGERRKNVAVQITYDGQQTMTFTPASDTDWDGTHPIMKRYTPEQTITVSLIEVDGEWKVYRLREVDHEYQLATWQHATEGNYDIELIEGYEPHDMLEPSKPFDIQRHIEGDYYRGEL